MFKSTCGEFGVFLPKHVVERMLSCCVRALPNETGGILIGHYNKSTDLALVSEATQAPKDSRAGRTWFYRGVHGLSSLLADVWKQGYYYVGEWHFHPLASATPSAADRKQLREISNDNAYSCAAPILLMLGGHPERNWLVSSYVFHESESEIELVLQDEEPVEESTR